jgi:hypothetical protein
VTGPRLRVEGSAPSAPLRGLLAVAQVVDYDLPARWAAGIEIDRRPCGCAEVWALDCEGSGDNVKQADPLEPSTAGPRFDSFTVIWSDFCSTLGRAPTAEQEAAARENLTAVEGSAIEREFWGGGLLGAAPHLADASADEVAPPAGIVDALAALETAIGDSCRAGVIHATPAAGTWLARYGLVTLSGQRLVTTALGTPVGVVALRDRAGADPPRADPRPPEHRPGDEPGGHPRRARGARRVGPLPARRGHRRTRRGRRPRRGLGLVMTTTQKENPRG